MLTARAILAPASTAHPALIEAVSSMVDLLADTVSLGYRLDSTPGELVTLMDGTRGISQYADDHADIIESVDPALMCDRYGDHSSF
jgi:hypothetical protein